jgi:GrpB-like predicted nucleotidyltransferase (UPF0157 family)
VTDAPVEIVPYDASWPDLFEVERAALRLVLSPWLAGPIEHVGSTAVPGLSAKPVIDVMAAVADLEVSHAARDALAPLGYHYAPYRDDVMHWFCKPSASFRTHHLHLVPFQSDLWVERLAFRDVLRTAPAIAAEYAALKRQLASRYRDDRDAYTEAKAPFVQRVLQMTMSHAGVRSG